ncbi:hypothetical protein AB6G29_09090 [Providencia hangzhouensis]|uniref:hypothetical protein n=1 Tax=Providencia hangzhouensis TaxID=3031799 RepID=UPI0034DD4DDF
MSESGQETHITSQGKVVIDAATEITLKSGRQFCASDTGQCVYVRQCGDWRQCRRLRASGRHSIAGWR